MSEETKENTKDTTVPYSRFKVVNEQRSAFEEQLKAAQAELASLQLRYDTDTTMLKAGVQDDQLADFVRYSYDKADLVRGKRPEFGSWLEDFRGKYSKLFEPQESKASPPKETEPEIEPDPQGKPQPQAQEEAPPKETKPQPQDTSDKTAMPQAQPFTKLSPRQIANLSREEFREYSAAMQKSLR